MNKHLPQLGQGSPGFIHFAADGAEVVHKRSFRGWKLLAYSRWIVPVPSPQTESIRLADPLANTGRNCSPSWAGDGVSGRVGGGKTDVYTPNRDYTRIHPLPHP